MSASIIKKNARAMEVSPPRWRHPVKSSDKGIAWQTNRDEIMGALEVEISNEGEYCGQVLINSSAAARYARVMPTVISLTRHFMPERRRVEAFIEKTYAEKYGAQLDTHYPYLMSARDASGHIQAAIGFRFASDEPLFLEHYLDHSIEREISNRLAKTVKRRAIAELGSLASEGQGATFFLFMVLADYLKAQGLSYAAITGTRVLQRFFNNLGLDPRLIAPADKTRLPDQGVKWGRYYDKNPQVLFGDIAAGCRLLPVAYRGVDGAANNVPPHLYAHLHHPLGGADQ